MEVDDLRIVKIKFQELREKADLVFDAGTLKDKFSPGEYFNNRFIEFYESLEKEIKSLPNIPLREDEINAWIGSMLFKIDKASLNSKLSATGRLFLRYRKKLRVGLLEIQSDLLKNKTTVHKELTDIKDTPQSFADIFTSPDWQKYIDALHEVDKPVITSTYEFIGNPKRHKGIICCWIKELQNRGLIGKNHSRQQLTVVLNREIKNLNLGNDGKTFDNYSTSYENNYKKSLLRRTNLLP